MKKKKSRISRIYIRNRIRRRREASKTSGGVTLAGRHDFLAMPGERFAQDTGDLVTVDAREAVPIYETRARKGARRASGEGGQGKEEGNVSFSFLSIASRKGHLACK